MRTSGVVAGLLILAAALILPNLDDRYLWDDESETALLAKNILRFGVPVAWDGASLISQECGTDYDANYLWRQTPWLPIYITAVSFALLDAGTFAARLPFALLGLLSVPSMYLLARRVFGDQEPLSSPPLPCSSRYRSSCTCVSAATTAWRSSRRS